MIHRNLYKASIDFVSLSEKFPRLEQFLVKGNTDNYVIDFKNVDAQRCLTEALLWRDFRLKLSLPEDRLCPPVPNRFNYIVWIQDALSESFRYLDDPPEIVGLDIGTGASAIYPLLGCMVDPTWRFVSTESEIDEVSFISAAKNVEQNGLSDRIKVSKVVSLDHILMPFYDEPERKFTFTMCNPPFYANGRDIERSAEGKALEPNSVCTGAEVEMVTFGGEVTFVRRMIEESVHDNIKDRCLWFTSMLGKLSSLEEIVGILRTYHIDNYAVTELVQGQTRRWVIAWTFTDVRLPDDLSRNLPAAHRALLPPSNEFRHLLDGSSSLGLAELREIIMSILSALESVSVIESEESSSSNCTSSSRDKSANNGLFICASATRNTWSRAARRAGKERGSTTGDSTVMTIDMSSMRDRGPDSCWVLSAVWRRGQGRALFESFWSHVLRKVDSVVKKHKEKARIPQGVGTH